MSLTALEMNQLDEEARTLAEHGSRDYLADALQCLRDTGDPIAPIALLRAMWNGGHARRSNPNAGLEAVGQWLERRLRRAPDLSPDHLALELGWLHRLVAVHSNGRSDDLAQGHAAPPGSQRFDARRPGPTFGAHLDLLRQRRQRARELAAAAALDDPFASPGNAARPRDASTHARPERLPDILEVRFPDTDVLDAFKNARKRQRAQKPIKDRLLVIEPVTIALRPLAADLACSLRDTQGLDALHTRTLENAGKLPSFWITVADLVERDGKRVVARIALEPEIANGTKGHPENTMRSS
jgi:hypothetical protein